MKQTLMVGLRGTLGTGQVEDLKMIKKKINGWKKIVNRFRGKLVKMIKDAGDKFEDYSIWSKFRQILLDWGHELTEKGFFVNSTN